MLIIPYHLAYQMACQQEKNTLARKHKDLIPLSVLFLLENDYMDFSSIKFHVWDSLTKTNPVSILANQCCKPILLRGKEKISKGQMFVNFSGSLKKGPEPLAKSHETTCDRSQKNMRFEEMRTREGSMPSFREQARSSIF